MSLSSSAYFKELALAYGLDTTALTALEERGFTNLGQLAFASPVAPSAAAPADSDPLWDALGAFIFTNKEDRRLPALRRLYFEAWVANSADIRSRLERGTDDPHRPLPDAEKRLRIKALQARLGQGLRIQGEHLPGDATFQLAHEIHESNCVRRLPLEKCITKMQEISGIKIDKEIKDLFVDGDGYLKAQKGNIEQLAELGGGDALMKVHDTLLRRGIALDIAYVLTFEVHALLVTDFMAAAKRDVAGRGCAPLSQLLQWDVEIWRRIAETLESGVRPLADGTRPLDAALKAALCDPRVALLLIPTSAVSGGSARSSGGSGPGSDQRRQSSEVKDLADAVRGLKRQIDDLRRNDGGGGDRQRAATRRGTRASTKVKAIAQVVKQGELTGMPYARGSDKLCFAFNSAAGCRGGSACKRGKHICGSCGSDTCKFVSCSRR